MDFRPGLFDRLRFPLEGRPWAALVSAVILVLLGTAIRSFFFGGLGRGTPYLTYYPMVMAAAILGGLPAGLLATLLSGALAYSWIKGGSLSPVEWLAMGFFVIISIMISLLAHTARVGMRKVGDATASEDPMRTRERLDQAVAGSDAGLWDWDIASDTVFYSDRFMRLLGHASHEFSGRMGEFWERLHSEDLDMVRGAIDRHLEEHEVFDVDYRLRTKSGEYRWFHARGLANWDDDGKPIRMSGSIFDITDRMKVREDLVNSEKRFRALMEQSPLAIEILSPGGKILEYNSAWSQLWGVTEEDAAAVVAEYNMLTDDQAIELGVGPLIQKAFAGEPVILPPIEYSSTRTADDLEVEIEQGLTPWIQCHLSPVKDEQGNVLFVVNTYVDITALKNAEAEAKKHQDVIARLDRATSMGQLTGSIAHELNQPLTGILSNAQAAQILLRDGRWEEEELVEVMKDIIADTKRGSEVIRNLRDLYREHKGDQEPFGINDIVAETRTILRSEFVMRQVQVTFNDSPSNPAVDGNRIQVQQVLVNLIMNGIEAMENVAREDRRLHIGIDADQTDVRVFVEDHGPGIDAERIGNIFEPLATWKPGGTGMGLAISNSIVEAHGGRMWVENLPGAGARVGFSIPLIKVEEPK